MTLTNQVPNEKEIGQLVTSLERAICQGDVEDAADHATELAAIKAKLKIRAPTYSSDKIKLNVIMADCSSTDEELKAVTLNLKVSKDSTVADIKHRVFYENSFPIKNQVWMIGTNVANDDKKLYQLLHIPDTKDNEGGKIQEYTVALYLCSNNNEPVDYSIHYTEPPSQDLLPPAYTGSPAGNFGAREQVTKPSTGGGGDAKWDCQVCTFSNSPLNANCEMCTSDRP